jgi:hypothetical protein
MTHPRAFHHDHAPLVTITPMPVQLYHELTLRICAHTPYTRTPLVLTLHYCMLSFLLASAFP